MTMHTAGIGRISYALIPHLFALAFAFNAGTYRAFAGPEVLVGVNTPATQRIALAKLSHERWNQLLKTFVNTQGMVDYKKWKSSAEAVQELDKYIRDLSSVQFSQRDSRGRGARFLDQCV